MEYIEIGQIVNTHGVKGHVKVHPFTDYPERFKQMKTVLAQKHDGSVVEYGIEETKYHKNIIILKFKLIENMDEAQKLKGFNLVIERKDLVKLPKDTYFIFDLVGCSVYEEKEFLGKIKDVIETGSNDVYVVDNEGGNELLIPALGWVILKVDVENKIINVKLPEGLREL